MRLILDDLAGFPGDLALEVVKGWRGDYAPTPAELVGRIEQSMRYARRLEKLEALRIARGAWNEPGRTRITKEQANAISERYSAFKAALREGPKTAEPPKAYREPEMREAFRAINRVFG